jgi:phage shock protein A
LREEVNELHRIVDELKARLDAVEKKPAAESATEEFAKVNKVYKTGDEKLDRLAKIMGA